MAATQGASGVESAVVDIRQLIFAWPGQQPVIDIPALRIAQGERVFLSGPSGSGKSTLLGLVGGVLSAGSGSVSVLGQELGDLRVAQRDRLRSDHIGFVFQMFNLLPYLSVIENVALACRFSQRRYQRAVERSGAIDTEAKRLLQQLDVPSGLMARKVTELSIGQQQRVAAARALIGAPGLVIADEPTSALDHDLRERFIDLLLTECDAAEAAVLFVSHDVSLGPLFDRQLVLAELNRAGSSHG